MDKLYIRAIRSTFLGAIVMAALIFLPAGTLNYWQGWVFFAVFFVGSSAIGLYLALYNPVLLERRMHVGPTAEKETSQKIIILFALLGFSWFFPRLTIVSDGRLYRRMYRWPATRLLRSDSYLPLL